MKQHIPSHRYAFQVLKICVTEVANMRFGAIINGKTGFQATLCDIKCVKSIWIGFMGEKTTTNIFGKIVTVIAMLLCFCFSEEIPI